MGMNLSETARKKFREKAREKFWSHNDRENYNCPDCGRSEAVLRKKFEVHHRDGDVTNNSLSNLVGLCQFCHNLREGKKASEAEQEQLRDQFYQLQNREGAPESPNAPVCRDRDHYSKIVNQHFEQNKPALVIKQIFNPHYEADSVDISAEECLDYYVVECDFAATSRLEEKEVSPANSGKMRAAELNDDGQDAVSELFQKYHDKAAESESHEYWPVFWSSGVYLHFKALRLPMAKMLSKELQFVIENTEYWTHDPREHEYRTSPQPASMKGDS